MKSYYKGANYAYGKEKVVTEAKDTSEGPVLAAAATKDPMALGAKKTAMRLDRPGRKMGGRVGSDSSPLSTAAKTTGRSGNC